MKFLVNPPSLASVRLSRPGPGGKGKISLTFPAKDRWCSIPDTACSVFAECVAKLIDAGTLIVPKRDGSSEALPAAKDLPSKSLPYAAPPEVEAPLVVVTEAEVEAVDLVSGDPVEESQTKPRRSRTKW